jgi:6-phosphofructokinase 1
VGEKSVEYAIQGKNAVMPSIVRTSDNPYSWEIQAVPLDQIANVEKVLPAEYIREDGFGITEQARTYLAALIKGEASTPWKNGLPVHAKIAGHLVDKTLPPWTS